VHAIVFITDKVHTMSSDDIHDIKQNLSDAERSLSNVGSHGDSGSHVSERRDGAQEAARVHEELERCSDASMSSGGTMNSIPGQKRSGETCQVKVIARDTPIGISGCGVGAVNLQQNTAAMQSGEVELDSQLPQTCSDRDSVYDSLSTGQKEAVDRMIADITQKHIVEMAFLQNRLDTSEVSSSTMQHNITSMQSGLPSNTSMQYTLGGARDAKITAEDERDDLKDVIAGLQARHEVQLHRLLEDEQYMKEEAKQSNDENKLKHAAAMRVIQEEVRVATSAGSSGDMKDNAVRDELEVLTYTSGIASAESSAEILHLKGLLADANAEIHRRDEVIAALPEVGGANILDFTDQHFIENLLRSSRENNQELISELATGRLQLFHMRQGHAADLLNMQHKLDAAKEVAPSAGSKGRPAFASAGRGRHRGANLSIINEEEDGVTHASTIPSNGSGTEIVSGDSDHGAVGTGAIEDAELNTQLQSQVVELLTELAAASQAKRQLIDNKTDVDAKHLSKVARLMKNLQGLNSQGSELNAEIALLMQMCAHRKDEASVEMEQAQQSLENARACRAIDAAIHIQASDDLTADHTVSLEELNEKLLCTLEMKRIDSVRLEDTKQEMFKMEERHQKMVTDLMARLQIYEAASPIEESDALNRMEIAETKRNQLRANLEQTELAWRHEIENAQQSHQTDLAVLSNLQVKLEEERVLHKQLLSEFQTKDERLTTILAALPPVEPSIQPPSLGWMEQLFAWLGSLSSPDGRLAEAGITEISCQNACWQILTFLPGTLALNCRTGCLEILDASKSAYFTWGSHALNGGSLFDLLPDKTVAAWLQKRFEFQPGLGDSSDFQLKQLPCVPLASKNSSRDCSLTCAFLPAEPQHSNESIVIVIINPIENPVSCGGWADQDRSAANGSEARSNTDQRSASDARPRSQIRGTPSGISVSSDDITANDSISNILPIY
jgi:hypothetical protein